MMRHNTKLEMQVLATIADKNTDDRTKARLRRKIKSIYFGEKQLEIWNAMQEDLKKHGNVPSFRALINDPGISDESKQMMKASLTNKLIEEGDVNKSISNLHKHYEARVTSDTHELIGKELARKTGPRPDAIKKIMSDAMTSYTSFENVSEFHKRKKAHKAFNATVDETAQDKAESGAVLKTGWPTYDMNAGGFNRGSLVIFAATAGSGKSTLAMTLARNVGLANPARNKEQRRNRTLIVSYELTLKEINENLISCLTGVEVDRVKAGTMTQKERDLAKSRYAKIVSDSGAIDIITPVVPRSIHDIFDLIGGNTYDLIVIDYAGLVEKEASAKRDEREDQKYGNMAKFCKQKAQELNCVVVLLAQLNEKDKSVMYSQQFRHNCDILWKWEVTDDDKEAGYFRIDMDKQRRSKTNFDFYLSTDFHVQQCNDVTQQAVAAEAENESSKKPKAKNGFTTNDKLA